MIWYCLEKLHTYTIVDAITDKNVLPFRIDYISTFREAEKIADTKVRDIDREKALAAPERMRTRHASFTCPRGQQLLL